MKPIFLKTPTQNGERFSFSSLKPTRQFWIAKIIKDFTVNFDKVNSFLGLFKLDPHIELALNSKSSQQTLNYPYKDLSEFLYTINYSSSS